MRIDRLIDVALLLALVVLLMPACFGQDWQRIHERYEKLNQITFPKLVWNSIYEREAATFYTRGQKFEGYKWQWSPISRYEVVCVSGAAPLPNQVSDTYVWDSRWWLGVVYETVLSQRPDGWMCKDQRCSFTVSSERTRHEQVTANTWNGRQSATKSSFTGWLRLSSDDQISEFFLQATPEDMFKRGVIDAQTLWIECERNAELNLLLPSQTTITNQRGKTRWTNRMTFSDYRIRD